MYIEVGYTAEVVKTIGENGDLVLEAIWIVASFIFGVGAAMTITSAPEYSPLWVLCIIVMILSTPGILWGCIYLLGFVIFLIFVLIVLGLILVVVLGIIQFIDTFVL